MKTLSHSEMLTFREAQDYPKKDNPAILAQYLIRRFYKKRLKDFKEMSKPFRIEANNGLSLEVFEDKSVLHSLREDPAKLKARFERINHAEDLSFPDMARNLARSGWNWVTSGCALVTQEVFAQRKALCERCEYWDGLARRGLGKCRQCGCTVFKLKFATEKCPIGRW